MPFAAWRFRLRSAFVSVCVSVGVLRNAWKPHKIRACGVLSSLRLVYPSAFYLRVFGVLGSAGGRVLAQNRGKTGGGRIAAQYR